MESRDQRIYEEAAALWQELFSEPPPKQANGVQMLDFISRNLGDAAYDRLRSPFLRPSTIIGPAQPRDRLLLG